MCTVRYRASFEARNFSILACAALVHVARHKMFCCGWSYSAEIRSCFCTKLLSLSNSLSGWDDCFELHRQVHLELCKAQRGAQRTTASSSILNGGEKETVNVSVVSIPQMRAPHIAMMWVTVHRAVAKGS